MNMKPSAWFGLGLVLAACGCALVAPLIAPHDPTQSSVGFLQGPSGSHLLGTDDLGRAILSPVIPGARTSVAIGSGPALVRVRLGHP